MGNEQPIGVFDSGVGGLSVLRALERRLPGEDYIYYGDAARAPYGDRSREEIRRFDLEIGSWLLAQHCKMLIVACNTSTVLGMDVIRNVSAAPVFGMMEAVITGTLDVAGRGGANGTARENEIWPVGFIATKGTVESGYYQKVFGEVAPGKAFIARACPDFVPLVEQGVREGNAVNMAVSAYLEDFRKQGIRSLVLGCTHYPFLSAAIRAFIGAEVRLVNPADSLAILVEDYLRDHAMLKGGDRVQGGRGFYCSGETARLQFVGSLMLGRRIEEVRRHDFS